MQVKTWLQRLTDESNLWFNAVKAEDEGSFQSAISYYMKDALECIRQHSLVRAALSCSCAANCLARMGAWSPARMLYSEAGRLYVENSEIAMSESIREALWSLQEAFENYALAGDDSAADTVRERYVMLAARTSPFSRAGQVAEDLESRRVESIKPDPRKKEASIPEELAGEIENFVRARRSGTARTDDSFDPSYVMRSIGVNNGGSRLDEKSIAS
ncbi:hypothetical protein Ngar_c23210 [Candidatus Nitrososphaera gargensis Ga9.2]|uniref:Uncharacterized protein n=1 Tax=Nitrososphaera gargensis (strain Ga9.2) TaxID=1237085 RepID=K0IL11_NITGG|nr:hypothetical protein [Candidatus Nitrososphaera gargensis]AFU59247.1 hypothetical protein Ngar_c23210 [Candidatus Nitrososphaera gargensis Ga9.2]